MPEENKKIIVKNNNTNTKTQPIPIKENKYVVSRPFCAKQTTLGYEFPSDRCICKTGRW